MSPQSPDRAGTIIHAVILIPSLTVLAFAAPRAATPDEVHDSPAWADSAEVVRALQDDDHHERAETRVRSMLATMDSFQTPTPLQRSELLELLAVSLWRGGKARDPEALEVALEALQLVETELGARSLEAADVANLIGNILVQRGEHTEARERYEQVLAIREDRLGPRHFEVGKIRLNLGNVALATGDYGRARRELELAVEIYEAELPPEDPRLGTALNSLGGLYYYLGEYAEAKPRWERALDIAEAHQGPDHLSAGMLLNNLGTLAMTAGSLAEADTLLRRALAIHEQTLGAAHPSVGQILGNLGSVSRDLGRFSEAEEQYERSLSILVAALGPDHPEVAQTTGQFSWLRLKQGRYQDARSLSEASLEVREKSLGSNHPYLAYDLRGMAMMSAAAGEYSGAREMLERALAIQEESLPEDSPEIANTLYVLGSIQQRSGDYAGAMASYERGLSIHRQAHGPRHRTVGEQLRDYGTLLLEIGQPVEALKLYREARSILEESVGDDHPDMAGLFRQMGRAHARLGQTETAVEHYDQALALHARYPEADPVERAATLNELGMVHAVRGEFELALELIEESISIQESRDGGNLGESLHDLGLVCSRMGKHERARACFERSVEALEDRSGAGHPSLAAPLVGLAEVLWSSGNRSAAFDAAERAEEITRDHLTLMAESMTEDQALAYAGSRPDGMQLLLGIALEDQAYAGRAWDALIRQRAIVLDELARRQRLVFGAQNVARVAEEFTRSQQRLANLLVRGATEETSVGYTRLLAEAREQAQRAERELARQSVAFQSQQTRREIGLREVAQALPAGAALAAFFRAPRRSHVAGPRSADRYGAFVLRPGDTTPTVVALEQATAVDSLANRWRRLASTPTAPTSDPIHDYRSVGAELREALWSPVRAELGSTERVLVVASGPLHFISLPSLPADDGGFLVESEHVIQVLSAERDLVPGAEPPSRGKGLLVMGGIDFDSIPEDSGERQPGGGAGSIEPGSGAGGDLVAASYRGSRPSCRDFEELSFGPLPGTAAEAEQIASLWEATALDRAVAEDMLLYTSVAADESAFKSLAPGRAVIHLATHGFFLGARCTSNSSESLRGMVLVGAPPPRADAGTDDDVTERWPSAAASRSVAGNPLHLSGLALAGANQRHQATSDREDGILTAEEIAAMNLNGVETVVLSACETGVGNLVDGEGIFGLRRAFEVSGVESLVMSLWSVDDEATRQWMAVFYRQYRVEGQDPARAARAASRAILRQRRDHNESLHPFFWGGFVVVGTGH